MCIRPSVLRGNEFNFERSAQSFQQHVFMPTVLIGTIDIPTSYATFKNLDLVLGYIKIGVVLLEKAHDHSLF